MTVKEKRAMPGWAYAALVLLAILFFAIALYLKEHAQRDGERPRVAGVPLQRHFLLSDSQSGWNAYAARRSQFNPRVIYIPAGRPNIISGP